MNHRGPAPASPHVVFAVLLLCGLACNMSDLAIDLSGGFTYIGEGGDNQFLMGGHDYTYPGLRDPSYTVPCKVEAFADTDTFILVEQRPMSCTGGSPAGEVVYWVVDHERRAVHGPLSHRDFLLARRRLGVPEDLELRPAP